MFDKILKAFPPPKFLDIPFAGIALSDSSVRCIQFGKKDGGLFIEKYTEKPVPSGVIVSGQINNKDAIVEILRDLKKDLSLCYVKMSLPEEKGYLFTAKIPMVKPEEVRTAIESKIEENVPVSPAELLFDYKLVDRNRTDRLDVAVSALPINVIDTYVQIAGLAGLSLLSLEIESQAIIRSLTRRGDKSTILIVNFGPGKVGLYVSSGRVVHFTSTISTKGQSSRGEEFLLQEINKLYVYWHTLKENVDKPERKIGRIIICGEKFSDTTTSYLSSNNQTEAVLGNVWINAFDTAIVTPEISFDDSLKYAAAIGLALPMDILIRD